MPSYKTTIKIAAPQEVVWPTLSMVAAWANWLPTVSSVEPLDGNALKVGARFIVRQPKLRPATWTVTELEPPHRFTWEARSPGLLMVAEHAIEEDLRGVSNVNLRFSFHGPIGIPIGWLFRAITERYIAQEAASLKLKVEGKR
jgi:uncharacterized protein YndB with AHSA1/START domain